MMLFMGRLTENLSFLQHIDSLLVTIIANGDMTIKRNFIPCYVTGTVLYVVSIYLGFGRYMVVQCLTGKKLN